jgi:hypothetical protein
MLHTKYKIANIIKATITIYITGIPYISTGELDTVTLEPLIAVSFITLYIMLQKVKYLFTSFYGTKHLENYLIHKVAA